MKKMLVMLLALGLLLPFYSADAAYNTYVFGSQDTLYFGGVAPADGEPDGITINIADNSYLHDYIADVSTLRIVMYPGSKLYLESVDRKLFTTDIDIAETICTDEYSSFSYETPDSYATFIITFTDDGNCPDMEIVEEPEPVLYEDSEEDEGDVINLFDLELTEVVGGLSQNDRVGFIVNNILEELRIESLASTQARVTLQKLNKEYLLKQDEAQNIDIDADDYRDFKLKLISITNGGAQIEIIPINVIKLANIKPGDLVKSVDSSAVYYIGEDSARYAFPNASVYYSWFEDFSQVKEISAEELAMYPLAGLVTYKPGIKLVTFTTSPDVYVVSKGGILRKLQSEEQARELYGDAWNKQVDDINDAFFSSYEFGDDLEIETDYLPSEVKSMTTTISIDKNI